jgi:hypothetical protein
MPRDRPAYAPYVRRLADLMGLRDWTFYVPGDQRPHDPDANAEVKCWRGRKHATVLFGESFLRADEADQRHSVVHELIHCHFAAMGWAAQEGLSADAERGWHLAFEYGVDGLADAVSPLLPLPSDVRGASTMGRRRPVKGETKATQSKPKAGPKPPPKDRRKAK